MWRLHIRWDSAQKVRMCYGLTKIIDGEVFYEK